MTVSDPKSQFYLLSTFWEVLWEFFLFLYFFSVVNERKVKMETLHVY